MTTYKTISAVILFAAVALSDYAVAQEDNDSFSYKTGADYVQNCSGFGDLLQAEPSLLMFLPQVMFCSGYTIGFMDGWTYMDNDDPKDDEICVPEKVTYLQMTKIVVKYIEEHPEREHEPVAILIPDALFDVFPCSSTKEQDK